jgi:hypothetical protein
MAQTLSTAVIEACRIAAGDPPTREAPQVVTCSGGVWRLWRGGKWTRCLKSHARAYPGEIAIAFDATLFPSLAYLVTSDGLVAIPFRGLAEEVEVVLPTGIEMVLPRPQQ